MPELTLTIGGRTFWGWKQLTVTRGIEQLAGTFELVAADRWAIDGAAAPIVPGAECRVSIDQSTLITGYVDEVEPTHDGRNHELSIRGRDKTADLVDCVALSDGQGWSGRKLSQIAADLCKPFGIPVVVAADEGEAFTVGRIEPDETVFETLARAARQRGVLLMSDGLGRLVITRAGDQRASTPLVLGQNILAGIGLHSHRDRFHRYLVRGQAVETSTESATAQQVQAEASDVQIRNARVTAVHAWDQMSVAQAQQLANWTQRTRRGRGQRATETVRGWLDGGTPWAPNQLVTVQDPWTRVNGEVLIAQVVYRLDPEQGQRTDLTVVPKAAYELLAEPERADAFEAGA